MYKKLTNRNAMELMESGGTFFEGASPQEYKILCHQADTFLATYRAKQAIKSLTENNKEEQDNEK